MSMLNIYYTLTLGASALKKTNLVLSVSYKNHTYTYKLPIRLYAHQWDSTLGQPANIYLKKLKVLNLLLIRFKLELIELAPTQGAITEAWLRKKVKTFFKNGSYMQYKMVATKDEDTLDYWVERH